MSTPAGVNPAGDRPLTGKIAFVTGSGRGLGRTMADKLASLGADVALHDLNEQGPAKYGEASSLHEVAKDVARHGTRVATVLGNIGDPVAVAEMSRRITAELGVVDILVNCAGGDIGSQGGKPVPNNALDIALEDIQVETDNNLIGTLLVCQAFVRPMRDRGSGCVVNIASAAAHMGATPEVVYATLKAAVVHYTRCLALEMRPFGVRVNAVSPGPDEDGPVPGHPDDRPGDDGDQRLPDAVRRSGGDRRRGGLPGRATGEVHPRAGAARRRWPHPVPG